MINSNSNNKNCDICINEYELSESKIPFSYWDTQDSRGELKRIQHELDYYECSRCGFERIATHYSDEFKAILYPKDFTSEAISSKPEIVEDIISWTNDELLNINKNKLVIGDFGCGTLSLLKGIKETHSSKDKILIGVDHRKPADHLDGDIEFYETDFDNPDFHTNLGYTKFDFIYFIHTLEHIFYPLDTLKTIRESLSDGGKLYIEVPANELIDKECLKSVALVHPQHLLYFSRHSLSLLLMKAGFEIIKSDLVITKGVPRLKFVANRSTKNTNQDFEQKFLNQDNDSKKLCLIENALNIQTQINKNAAKKIENYLKVYKYLNIWGLGIDFLDICKASALISEKIKSGNIRFIDSFLHDKKFRGIIIKKPNFLLRDNAPIIIPPLLSATRQSITSSIEDMKIDTSRILNIY